MTANGLGLGNVPTFQSKPKPEDKFFHFKINDFSKKERRHEAKPVLEVFISEIIIRFVFYLQIMH